MVVVEMQQEGDGRVVKRIRNGEAVSSTQGIAAVGGDGHKRQEVAAKDGKESEQKLLTLPTILTLSRVAAVPAMLAGLDLFSNPTSPFWLFWAFLLGLCLEEELWVATQEEALQALVKMSRSSSSSWPVMNNNNNQFLLFWLSSDRLHPNFRV